MSQEAADNLVSDYKARLSPYVKAMKERGYFGEAMKLQAQQQAQIDHQNDKSEGAQAKQTKQASAPVAKSPQGQSMSMAPKTGLDPVAANPGMPSDLNHGVDLPDGDYLSVSKEVKPDESGQESRAPDVTAAVRPAPVKSDGFS